MLCFPMVDSILAKQLKYGLRSHISLSQHRSCSLLENLVFGEGHDLFSHVEVTDPRLSGLKVLC